MTLEEMKKLESMTSLTVDTSHMTREQIAELVTEITEIMRKTTPNQCFIYLDECSPFTEEHALALDRYVKSKGSGKESFCD